MFEEIGTNGRQKDENNYRTMQIAIKQIMNLLNLSICAGNSSNRSAISKLRNCKSDECEEKREFENMSGRLI